MVYRVPFKIKLSHYQKIFLIRFFSYFCIIWGFLTLILIVEPVFTEEFKYQFDALVGNKHTLGPKVVTSRTSENKQSLPSNEGQNVGISDATSDSQALRPSDTPQNSSLGSLLSGSGSSVIVPSSTDFGIVIEKINANAKVIEQVDPTNEGAYSNALSKGVAQAKGTVYPGQNGNIYLFSHSTDAPWNIVRFNAIFYLLSKLEKGDNIAMFYKGRRYDYTVFDKTITSSSDVHFLTNVYKDSILTMQTCDPPGTLLNRLVVRAKLASI